VWRILSPRKMQGLPQNLNTEMSLSKVRSFISLLASLCLLRCALSKSLRLFRFLPLTFYQNRNASALRRSGLQM
jgi:hypothetical protein